MAGWTYKLRAQPPATGPIGEEIHNNRMQRTRNDIAKLFQATNFNKKCSKSYESSFHDQATHGQGSNTAAVNRAPTYKATPE